MECNPFVLFEDGLWVVSVDGAMDVLMTGVVVVLTLLHAVGSLRSAASGHVPTDSALASSQSRRAMLRLWSLCLAVLLTLCVSSVFYEDPILTG